MVTKKIRWNLVAMFLGGVVLFLTLLLVMLLSLQREVQQRFMAERGPYEDTEGSKSGYFLSGYYAFIHGHFDQAAEQFRVVLRDQQQGPHGAGAYAGDPLLLRLAYEATLFTKGLPDALALIREHHESPEIVIGYLPLIVEAVEAERYHKALGLLDKMQAQGGGDMILVPFLTSWCKAGEGKWKEAVSGLQKISNAHAQPLVNFHLALMYDFMGDSAQAHIKMGQAMESYLYSYTSYAVAANFYARHGEPGDKEKAAAIYQHYRELYPFSDYFSEELAALRSPLPHPAQTGKPLALIADPKAMIGDLMAEMASGFLQNQLFPSALIYTELAAYLWPTHPQIAFVKGRGFELSGHTDAAIMAYHAVPEKHLFYVQARVNMAALLFKQGDSSAAKQLLKHVARQHHASQDVLIALADIYMQENTFGEAITTYTTLITRAKSAGVGTARTGAPAYEWPLYFLRGIAYDKAEKWSLAETDLLKALALNPEQVDVQNYLGYSWLDRGQALERAAKLIQAAYQRRPTDVAVMDSMAWLLYHMHRYSEAEILLEKAVSMQTDDPTIHEHLGDVYWRLRRPIQAGFEWQHALALSKEAKDIARIEKKRTEGVVAVLPFIDPSL